MSRILIVDDRESGRESLKVLLSSLDFQVATADTVETAAAMAEHFEPDVAIIDWFLNEHQNGGQVANRLTKMAPQLQVIFITGADSQFVTAAMPRAQVLCKPFQVGELLEVIELHTGGQPSDQ